MHSKRVVVETKGNTSPLTKAFPLFLPSPMNANRRIVKTSMTIINSKDMKIFTLHDIANTYALIINRYAATKKRRNEKLLKSFFCKNNGIFGTWLFGTSFLLFATTRNKSELHVLASNRRIMTHCQSLSAFPWLKQGLSTSCLWKIVIEEHEKLIIQEDYPKIPLSDINRKFHFYDARQCNRETRKRKVECLH